MPIDCNDIKNKKTKQLIDGIESWVNREDVIKNIQSPYDTNRGICFINKRTR